VTSADTVLKLDRRSNCGCSCLESLKRLIGKLLYSLVNPSAVVPSADAIAANFSIIITKLNACASICWVSNNRKTNKMESRILIIESIIQILRPLSRGCPDCWDGSVPGKIPMRIAPRCMLQAIGAKSEQTAINRQIPEAHSVRCLLLIHYQSSVVTVSVFVALAIASTRFRNASTHAFRSEVLAELDLPTVRIFVDHILC